LKKLSLFVAILLACACAGQETPVTRHEFVVLLDKIVLSVEHAFAVGARPADRNHGYSDVPQALAPKLRKLVAYGIFPPGDNRPFNGSLAVSRFTVALALDAFFVRFERLFVTRPVKLKIRAGSVRGRLEDGSHEAMTRLAQNSILPLNSPILVGPGDRITPRAMSSALAQALEAFCARCIRVSSR
jgi:hypothetical protein